MSIYGSSTFIELAKISATNKRALMLLILSSNFCLHAYHLLFVLNMKSKSMLGTKVLFACTEKTHKKKSQCLKIRVYKIDGFIHCTGQNGYELKKKKKKTRQWRIESTIAYVGIICLDILVGSAFLRILFIHLM